jgi:hypothetical protein
LNKYGKLIVIKVSSHERSTPGMVSKELKRLSRRELVDIIYQMKKNEQLLQDEIAS